MAEYEDIQASDIEAFIRMYGLVPIPPALMPRVIQAVRDHRAALRRFGEAGIDVHDVFPAQIYRA